MGGDALELKERGERVEVEVRADGRRRVVREGTRRVRTKCIGE